MINELIENIRLFVSLCLGSIIGAGIRWMLGLWLNPFSNQLELGTLVVNVIGCALMGVAMAIVLNYDAISIAFKTMWITGFLGSMTTFSGFVKDVIFPFQSGDYIRGFIVITLHMGLGLFAMLVFFILANFLIYSLIR